MGNQPKIHWVRKLAWRETRPDLAKLTPEPVLCGSGATFTTDDPEKITCGTCKRILENGPQHL